MRHSPSVRPWPARLALAVAFTAAATITRAAGPTFWTVATPAEFLKGTSDGVAISAQGALTPGPVFANRMTSSPAQVWSVAETADGTLWAGTGGEGTLLRLRAGQPDETAFDADEPHIFAVAAAGTRVYFASSPDGRVYAADGAAAPRVVFDPAEKYIWALTVDAAGRLWVGTGSPAAIYRIDADGTNHVVYRPPAGHVVALAVDRDGRLLAGTESPGRLYRLGADGRPFALLDSGLSELRALAVDADGTIYAAAMQRADDAAGSPGATAAAASAPTVPGAAATPLATSSGGASPASAGRSLLYRIDPNGSWETVCDTPELIYDVAVGDAGAVFIATGPAGRLYRLDRGRELVLVTGVDARQIMRLGARARGSAAPPMLATANPGRVLVPGAAPQSPAVFTSAVRDTKGLAAWGLLRWDATGSVTLQTRSGNTDTPDDSWSDWSAAYTASQGEAITSPAARFIQWKAVLHSPAGAAGVPAPRLTSVTLAYLARNTRPAVSSITVYPPGVVFQRPYSTDDAAIAGLDDATMLARRPPDAETPASSPGKRMFQKGLQTVAWKADDADGDRLTYALQYRREGDTEWHDWRSGLFDPLVVWDTTSVPDGRYVVRVLASDAPTNAADRARTGERESEVIDVDNTPPTITIGVVRQGAATRLNVRIHDARSPILKIEYAIGGGPWQVVAPTDGLADAPDERVDIDLPPGVDASRIVVRATDLLLNVATAAAGR